MHAEVVVPDALHASLLPDQQPSVSAGQSADGVHSGQLRCIGPVLRDPERMDEYEPLSQNQTAGH